MIHWSLEEQLKLYDLFISAINSDNADYILEQLSKMYTMIYSNNINLTENIKLEEKK